MNKNFIQRTVAGAVLVILILSSIWFSKYGFFVLFCIISALLTAEFHKLTNRSDVFVPYIVAVCASVVLFAAFFLYFAGFEVPFYKYIFILYAVIVLGFFLYELFKKSENPINNLAYFVLGQVYIALPLSLLNGILFYNDVWTPVFLIALFVTIWLNDTCAYLVGSKFGKHRLFKRVSPKKSWEGFIGGAFGALLSGCLFYCVVPIHSLWFWLIFVEIVVVFGTFGDLLESLLKRTVGVKDSGHIIPGHGGMLDRFDSLLLSSPIIYLYMYMYLIFI
jgi:phosphatidate cytidylyltransferase